MALFLAFNEAWWADPSFARPAFYADASSRLGSCALFVCGAAIASLWIARPWLFRGDKVSCGTLSTDRCDHRQEPSPADHTSRSLCLVALYLFQYRSSLYLTGYLYGLIQVFREALVSGHFIYKFNMVYCNNIQATHYLYDLIRSYRPFFHQEKDTSGVIGLPALKVFFWRPPMAWLQDIGFPENSRIVTIKKKGTVFEVKAVFRESESQGSKKRYPWWSLHLDLDSLA